MNGEVVEANPVQSLKYVESEDRRTVIGPGFRLTFCRLGDRWTHALTLGGDTPTDVAQAVEGDPERDDPARVVSPTYQEIQEHAFPEGVQLLLTGQSTPHHFSAVVTVRVRRDGVTVEFDVADRCREPVAVLAATYVVCLPSGALVGGGDGRIAWSGEALGGGSLEFASGPPGAATLAEAGRRGSRVQASGPIDPGRHTHRLAYHWHWTPPAARPAAGAC